MNAETRSRIEALFGDYVQAIDEDQLEQWPELFTENCHYLVTNRDNYKEGLSHGAIYANSRGMLADRVSALREANIYEEQTYRHIVGSIHVLGEEKGIAKVKSNFLVVRTMHDGDMQLFATGTYLDRIEVSGERVRFVERLVVCDSQKFDTLLALPI